MSEPVLFESYAEPPLTRPTQRRIISIRWTLPLFVVTPVIIGIGLTSWLAYKSGRNAVEDTINKISTEVANNIETEVVSYLEAPILVSKMLVSEVNSGILDIQDMAAVTSHLSEISKTVKTDRSSQNIENLFYANESGAHAASRIDTANYDRRKRPWYEDAKNAKAAIWADVYNDQKTSSLVLPRATPIFNQAGGLEGIFGIDIFLPTLSDFLRNLKVSPTGQAFILEMEGSQKSTGELIATPAAEILVNEQSGDNNSLKAIESENELVNRTAAYILNIDNGSLFQECDLNGASNRNFSDCEFTSDGQKYLFRVNYLGEYGIPWLIVVTIPQNDYMGSIYAIVKQAILIGVLIILLASLLALAGAMYMIRPIEKLNQAANDIKQHQFNPDTLADVMQRPDEFSILADVFDDMATVVVSREQSLSDQVKQLEVEKLQYGTKGGDRYALDAALHHAKQVRSQYRKR